LVIAAADPLGDVSMLWRAAARLELAAEAAAPAQAVGLIEIGRLVQFRDPRCRAAVYRWACAHDRRQAHLALAEVTAPEVDPDWRAWHRAQAAEEPDEEVAVDLERSIVRAQARGGLAATAALLQRAAALTPDPARRTDRSLAAAEASLQAGGFDAALGLLATAEVGPLDEIQRARVELVRAYVAFSSGPGPEACARLTMAAKRLESLDSDRRGWTPPSVIHVLWDPERSHAVCSGQVQVLRDAGAHGVLPVHLAQLAMTCVQTGDFEQAEMLLEEADGVAAGASPFVQHASLALAAFRGSEVNASVVAVPSYAHWAAAVACNGLGRYAEAASAAREATADMAHLLSSVWAWPELIEAAARIGDTELAHEALERLAQTTQPCGTDLACGIEARCRALLSDGAIADELYREAVHRLSRTVVRPELARTHLLYGEWLRREGRRVEARESLRIALELCAEIGMEAFAERARGELAATGERVRKRTAETRDDLTPQERQITRLAGEGLSNPEIGARLFLSPRTVEWHLRKVFSKLGVRSRRELAGAIPDADPEALTA
jgi:DNA-binding CsgD family transcriptional regulator